MSPQVGLSGEIKSNKLTSNMLAGSNVLSEEVYINPKTRKKYKVYYDKDIKGRISPYIINRVGGREVRRVPEECVKFVIKKEYCCVIDKNTGKATEYEVHRENNKPYVLIPGSDKDGVFMSFLKNIFPSLGRKDVSEEEVEKKYFYNDNGKVCNVYYLQNELYNKYDKKSKKFIPYFSREKIFDTMIFLNQSDKITREKINPVKKQNNKIFTKK